MIPSKDQVLEALSSVQEPDLKKNIVELKLVDDLVFTEQSIAFSVKVHNPALHNRKKMVEACEFAIHRFISKEIKVQSRYYSIASRSRAGSKKSTTGSKKYNCSFILGKEV